MALVDIEAHNNAEKTTIKKTEEGSQAE